MHLFFFHQNFIKRFRYFSQAFRRFRYFFITDKDNYLLLNINKYNKSQSLDFSGTFGKHQEEQAKLILNAVKACVLSHHRSPAVALSAGTIDIARYILFSFALLTHGFAIFSFYLSAVNAVYLLTVDRVGWSSLSSSLLFIWNCINYISTYILFLNLKWDLLFTPSVPFNFLYLLLENCKEVSFPTWNSWFLNVLNIVKTFLTCPR